MDNCSKCGGEREEHDTPVSIVVGKIRQKRARAIVCKQCGYIEFYL